MGTGSPVALVTGAGSGIGRATAIQLSQRGFRLALSGRREEPLVETGRLLPGAEEWVVISADVGAPGQAERMIDKTVAAFGRLDALINNAGAGDLRRIAEHSPGAIDDCFAVNAIGPIRAIVRAWPIFERQGGGCVVNVSSMATDDPFPGLGVYGAAKAALNVMARACIGEGSDVPIRAFSVAPGAVETPMLRAIFSADDLPSAKCLSPEEIGAVIVACVVGERDAENGSTIFLPSP